MHLVGCIVLSLIVGVFGDALSATEGEYQAMFTAWSHKHGKSYSSGEFLRRYETFKASHQAVTNHNSGSLFFKIELNAFSDITYEEFRTTNLGAVIPRSNATRARSYESLPDEEPNHHNKRACAANFAVCGGSCCPSDFVCTTSQQCIKCDPSYITCPTGQCCPLSYTCDSTGCAGAQTSTGSAPAPNVNWTATGFVTPVKDQGNCGSCWSFAATGTLEAAWNKNRNLTGANRVVLAEQNLLDCAGAAYGNNGCGGGSPTYALSYIKANGGIDSTASYPLFSNTTGVVGTCKYTTAGKAASVTNVTEIVGETALQTRVNIQPVVIAINAAPSLQGYANGVYNDPACGTGSSAALNHAVLVVGYGTDPKAGAYWIAKNSWGAKWGINGYFLLQRGVGRCGVGQYAVYPTSG